MAAVLRLTGLARSGLVRPRLGYSLLLLVTGLFCCGLTQAAPALLTQGTYVSHAGHVYVKGGGNAATLSVTVVAASATYPAGTLFSGPGGLMFTSMTDDPLGPFSGQSVHFRGNNAGGIRRVYRYRLDFDQEVTLDSIVVEGAAWGFLNDDTISLLDEQGNEITTINAVSPGGVNNFQRQVLDASGTIGRIFFLAEFNEATIWRYRSNIEVNLSGGISDPPAPPPPPPAPSGGGGCTVGPSDGTIDPTLPLLMLISLVYLARRRLSET